MVVARTLIAPDIPQQAAALLMIIVPSLVTIVGGFILGETYSDHSERKNTPDK